MTSFQRRASAVLVTVLAAAPFAGAAEPAGMPATMPAAVTSETMTAQSGAPMPPIAPHTCPVLSTYADGVPLAHVQAALQPGGHLDVLVIGSGTVLGPEEHNPDMSFPYRMARALKAAVPDATISLTVRGGKGLTAAQMVPLLRQELAAGKFQLVLWQTGTVEAMRNLPVAQMAQALSDGTALVQASGADLILIDPQFSRFLRANADLAPYQNALERAGSLPDVSLFHRFELMHAWADDGGLDLERAATAERRQTADLLHACLGRALAQRLLNAAGLQAALVPPK